ncbi:hypothetical protein ABT299_38715 [Spirillospora sp. NPDC000708]
MPLFGRRKAARTGTAAPPDAGPQCLRLDSGRRFRSGLALDDALRSLTATVESYGERPYEHMPLVHQPGFVWLGPDEPPARVVGFHDTEDDFVFGAFWKTPAGTESGLFPLGAGPDRLNRMKLPGMWKRRDPSLASIGTLPPGIVGLTAPRLSPTYLEDIVRTAGFQPSEGNLAVLHEHVRTLFLIKASQFIGMRQRAAAERFADAHEDASAQQVLDGLASTLPVVTPYIQALPDRVRGLLLESVDEAQNPWRRMHR